MARLTNARSNHITRWVIPAARRLLIEQARKEATIRPLAQVARIEMGQSPRGDCLNDDGEGIPFIGGPADLGLRVPQTTRWTSIPTKLCEADDIIVCVRATIGEPRWADGVYCLGRGVAGVRPVATELNRQFLFHIIEASQQELREQGTGTTFKTISKRHLSAIQIPIIPLNHQQAIGAFLGWLEQNSNTRPDFTQAPPLPRLLSEQKRIVERIEDLAAKVEEARGLRETAHIECEILCRSILFDESNDVAVSIPLHELVTLRKPDVTVVPTETYHFAGVYCFGKGVFSGGGKVGFDFSYRTLTRLEAGNFVYPKLMAWEGALGIVPPNCNGLYVSPEFPVFEVNEKRVLPEVLDVYFRTPSVWPQLADASTGTNVRRRRLHPKNFLSLEIPVPSMKTQWKLRSVKAKVDAIKQLQTETAKELNVLLPSILDKAFKGDL